MSNNTVNKFIMPNGDEIKIDSGSGLELCDIGMALYVDETKGLRRYLNGQIVDRNTNTEAFFTRLQEITTLHPSLLCTEEEWQTAKTMSAFGQVGKFVFNYSGGEIVSVRLPRVVNVQGLFDLQNLGMTVCAGLPNIKSGISLLVKNNSSSDGPYITGKGFYTSGVDWRKNTTSDNSSGLWSETVVNIDASLSNPIYGNSATVQPEAIQYPYFIQVATGSETENNIVNTLENVNGFTLLESKYSDKPLYNESWLLSNGQWNAKAVYPTAYEGLQVEYNTEIEVGTTVTLPSGVSYTKRGLSVKLSTETYTDYDFVLNTADETFRLPLKTKQKFYDDIAPVVGNGKSLGFTTGSKNFGLIETANQGVNNVFANRAAFNVPVGKFTPTAWDGEIDQALGVTTDPTKSGIQTHLTETTLYLYFYVGDIDQNHGIVNMGRIGEVKADRSELDGNWVTNGLTIISSKNYAIGVYDNLNSLDILPNDGRLYKCIFRSFWRADSTSGTSGSCPHISTSFAYFPFGKIPSNSYGDVIIEVLLRSGEIYKFGNMSSSSAQITRATLILVGYRKVR